MDARPLPASALVERFRSDLGALIASDVPVGLAVSGGADSMALLLLAAAARPKLIHVATVDHALRPESRGEAEQVARLCRELQVTHDILTASWERKPETGIQQKARDARYGLLGDWAHRWGLGAVATGHHLDDQAETLVMRLGRGVGVRGLAGMRSSAPVPGCPDVTLLRPLLGWRQFELERVCADADVSPVADPSNVDPGFERVRVRDALAQSDLLDPEALARSAKSLAQADAAIEWAARHAWEAAVHAGETAITIRPAGLPAEILRRLVSRAVAGLASEGGGSDLRGRDLDQLLKTLGSGGRSTLRGVLCSGGPEWRFIPAPNRTRRSADRR